MKTIVVKMQENKIRKIVLPGIAFAFNWIYGWSLLFWDIYLLPYIIYGNRQIIPHKFSPKMYLSFPKIVIHLGVLFFSQKQTRKFCPFPFCVLDLVEMFRSFSFLKFLLVINVFIWCIAAWGHVGQILRLVGIWICWMHVWRYLRLSERVEHGIRLIRSIRVCQICNNLK